MSSLIASGLTAGKNSTTPDATFVWSVEEVEACQELRVKASYGGGADTSNPVEVHIPWGSTTPYQIGPGRNPNIKVSGEVAVVWGNYDSTAKKYTSFAIVFSGTMVLVGSNGIASSDQSSSAKNKLIVYTHLA